MIRCTDGHKVSREKANWKEWPQAELIRQWETGDFDYEHFKDTDNALVLRYAYKACMPNAEPRSVSRIMRVSAQVAAGWYKTPLEAPHCNPPRDKSDEASPKATPLKKTPAKETATKATTPAGLTPTKATPAKTATAKTAKTAPPKTPPAKDPSTKTTPAKTSKPKTTPAQETNVARGTEAVKSLAEKVQAKKTPVKKTPTKKNTTVNTSAEPNQITTPTPVRGIKRAHDTTSLAGEMDGGESQQQPAGKKAKTSMQQ
jgi:hypothetical protein